MGQPGSGRDACLVPHGVRCRDCRGLAGVYRGKRQQHSVRSETGLLPEARFLFCFGRPGEPCPYGGAGSRGTATLVQAVNDLPKAQASLRDEFAGTARGGGHCSPSQRRPVVVTFAPPGRMIVGRSFTACATTVIATAWISTRYVHRRPAATTVRAWRAAGTRLSPGHASLPPHAVPMSLDNGTCLRRALTSISGRLITFIPAA
jgi:hypothetical protein